jgi:hypothetical protein
VVEHSTQTPEITGLNPVGFGRKEMAKKSFLKLVYNSIFLKKEENIFVGLVSNSSPPPFSKARPFNHLTKSFSSDLKRCNLGALLSFIQISYISFFFIFYHQGPVLKNFLRP